MLAVDQAAKALVRARVPYGGTARLMGVGLHHTHNAGLFGGGLPGAAVPAGVLTAAGIAVALVLYARRPALPRGQALAAGLLLGGATGNLADRLRLGYVTDFVARGDRNAFNLADLAIYVAIGLFLLLTFRRDGPATPPGA